VNKVTNAEKEKNRGKRRTHRSLAGGDGAAVSLQMEIQSPLVMSGKGSSNGSNEGEDVVRRQAEAPACRRVIRLKRIYNF
jgi:hypothetical protein